MWRFTLFFGLLLTATPAFAFVWTAPAIFAAISAAATVATAVVQYGAAKDQQKAQKQLQRQAALKAARERIQQIRQARIKAAQIEQQGEGAGVSASSGVQGGVGSVQSQLGSNLNFMDVTQIYGNKATNYLADAAKANSLANTISAVGSLAYSGYNLTKGDSKPDAEGTSNLVNTNLGGQQ